MINLNNIFSLFENEGESSSKKSNENTFVDFTNNPGYYLGMWKKIILNKKNIIKKFSEILFIQKTEISKFNIEEGGEYFLYNRAWGFLCQLDVDFNVDDPTILPFIDKYLFETFDLGINFFTECEEFEICAFILKIKKKLEFKFGEIKNLS
jgi:hypothetical protein